MAPYCATKWAIEGLTRALADELPSGMAAIPLNPGIIDTDMLRSCFGESASAYPTAQQWGQTGRAIPTPTRPARQWAGTDRARLMARLCETWAAKLSNLNPLQRTPLAISDTLS